MMDAEKIADILSHFRASAEGRHKGAPLRIVSDYNGTLALARAGEPLNMQLLTFLSLAKQCGAEVTVSSNDAAVNEGGLKLISMRHFGKAGYFGDMEFKGEWDGKTAFIVADDDHNSHRIKADHYLDPLDSETLEALNKGLLALLNDKSAGFVRGAPVVAYRPVG